MVWVIAFGELFFGDLWCVVWGYGGMRTHFSLLSPQAPVTVTRSADHGRQQCRPHSTPSDMDLARTWHGEEGSPGLRQTDRIRVRPPLLLA